MTQTGTNMTSIETMRGALADANDADPDDDAIAEQMRAAAQAALTPRILEAAEELGREDALAGVRHSDGDAWGQIVHNADPDADPDRIDDALTHAALATYRRAERDELAGELEPVRARRIGYDTTEIWLAGDTTPSAIVTNGSLVKVVNPSLAEIQEHPRTYAAYAGAIAEALEAD